MPVVLSYLATLLFHKDKMENLWKRLKFLKMAKKQTGKVSFRIYFPGFVSCPPGYEYFHFIYQKSQKLHVSFAFFSGPLFV